MSRRRARRPVTTTGFDTKNSRRQRTMSSTIDVDDGIDARVRACGRAGGRADVTTSELNA